MTDKQLVQLICAYRLFNPEVELSLSTRESPQFRDNVLPLGITSMSAASKTQPGGYATEEVELEQFEISDERSAASVEDMIRAKGSIRSGVIGTQLTPVNRGVYCVIGMFHVKHCD